MKGDLKFSYSDTDHGNWLLCDGRSLLISNYRCLYNVIGNKFGQLSSNTFNLPNCKGKVLKIANNNADIGNILGEYTHKLTTDEIPSHNHSGYTNIDGVHNHGKATSGDGLHYHGGYTDNETMDGGTTADPYNSHVINTGDQVVTGSDGDQFPDSRAGSNSVVKSGSLISITLNTKVDGIHQHGINYDGHHSHNIGTDNGHVHTFTTNNSNNNIGRNNIQPTTFIGNVFIEF